MATYIVRAGLSGPVKIGKADHVSARVRELQTAHYEQLHVIRMIVSNIERELHRKYQHLHIRGEWFQFDNEMLSFNAEDLAKQDDGSDFQRLLDEYSRAINGTGRPHDFEIGEITSSRVAEDVDGGEGAPPQRPESEASLAGEAEAPAPITESCGGVESRHAGWESPEARLALQEQAPIPGSEAGVAPGPQDHNADDLAIPPFLKGPRATVRA